MKKVIFGILALILIISFSGCDDGKSLNGLINHLKENDIKGKRYEKSFGMIGAINGCGYQNHDGSVSLELYEFQDADNVYKMMPYKNGRFGLLVHTKDSSSKAIQHIIKIFKNY